MAETIVPQSTATLSRGVPSAPNITAIDLLDEARSINILITWIERARNICEFVAAAASRDKDFADRCVASGVPFNAGMWDSEESSSLDWLQCEQLSRLADAKRLVEGQTSALAAAVRHEPADGRATSHAPSV